jgi:hypothetical protein
MIVKIKTSKSAGFGKLLTYMMNKKERLFDTQERSFVISHHLRGNTIKQWEKQLTENESHRLRKRKDTIKLYHEILSWHKDDAKNLTLPMLEDMAREYIKQRNPNGIYIAVPHFDKDHYHIHICVSGVEYKTGKSLRLSKAALGKLKNGIQKYQIEKYPELTNSVVEHGKRRKQVKTDKEYKFNWREGRETDKEKLQKLLGYISEKAKSQDEFYNLLKDEKLEVYNRNGKPAGVIFNGRKFRFSRLETRHDTSERADTRINELSRLRMKKTKEHGRFRA